MFFKFNRKKENLIERNLIERKKAKPLIVYAFKGMKFSRAFYQTVHRAGTL